MESSRWRIVLVSVALGVTAASAIAPGAVAQEEAAWEVRGVRPGAFHVEECQPEGGPLSGTADWARCQAINAYEATAAWACGVTDAC